MSHKYNNRLIPLAKQLRKDMTAQERRLWYQYLRMHPIRFQRQKVIGNYIVDFYCHRAKLVIEIDGSQHYTDEGQRYDEKRDEVLKSLGLSICRVANNDVNERFSAVCQHIDCVVLQRVSDSLSQLR